MIHIEKPKDFHPWWEISIGNKFPIGLIELGSDVKVMYADGTDGLLVSMDLREARKFVEGWIPRTGEAFK